MRHTWRSGLQVPAGARFLLLLRCAAHRWLPSAPPVVVTGKASVQISPVIALTSTRAVPDERQTVLHVRVGACRGCVRHKEEEN